MIDRTHTKEQIKRALKRRGVVVLSGPRQVGKTTLAREFLSETSVNYFDLEDPPSLARLDEPKTALEPLRGLVVIDEVQRRPDLFPVIRVLADRADAPARFLILGSASGDLLRQSSESLAGRVEKIEMGGFQLRETGVDSMDRLWRRGAFPDSFLAETEPDSVAWRRNFIQTLLERDLPQWGVRAPTTALLRFWTMLAHYHGQAWNAAEPARALGVNPTTVRRYLDILTDALMVRQLQPWHANIAKRQIKAPKIYLRDSGLLHRLLGIDDKKSLFTHPRLGASWEGFVIEQVLANESYDDAWFWATHQGAEIDLILRRGDSLYGIECKRSDAPRLTPSMRSAMDDLQLKAIAVIYPGDKRYTIAPQVEAVPLRNLTDTESLFA